MSTPVQFHILGAEMLIVVGDAASSAKVISFAAAPGQNDTVFNG